MLASLVFSMPEQLENPAPAAEEFKLVVTGRHSGYCAVANQGSRPDPSLQTRRAVEMASATHLEKHLQLGLGIALTIGLVTPVVPAQKQDSVRLSLTSSAFGAGQGIPAVHTCDGRNLSPPLSWSGISPKAKSLALIMEDPDAPNPAAPQ
ncbi:MAG TPA: hypothetical protein VL051_03780, partial [Burkholderiaceae bacterium]|nr:hypothetical protein [Burkholderiaceae bacterium]